MSTDYPAPNKNNVTINQIQPGSTYRTQNGADVKTVKVADQTGAINLCLWNEQSENIALKKSFTLRNGFVALHKGRLSLSYAKAGELTKLDVTLPYVEQPDMSVYNAENDLRGVKRSATTDDDEGVVRKQLPDPNKHVFINQLQPGMKNLNTVFIVTEVGMPRQTSQGNEVRTIRVADHTGSVQMAVWNEVGEFVSPSDIYRLRNGCVVVHKGCMSLSTPKTGEMLKTGEFFMLFNELPDMSAYNPELDAYQTPSSKMAGISSSRDDGVVRT